MRIALCYSLREVNSSRLAFGYSSSQKYKEHTALCDKLGMAESVSIRYDPANPAESVLTYGLNSAKKQEDNFVWSKGAAVTWI